MLQKEVKSGCNSLSMLHIGICLLPGASASSEPYNPYDPYASYAIIRAQVRMMGEGECVMSYADHTRSYCQPISLYTLHTNFISFIPSRIECWKKNKIFGIEYLIHMPFLQVRATETLHTERHYCCGCSYKNNVTSLTYASSDKRSNGDGWSTEMGGEEFRG